jgi:multiple sugar transport system substrate-binding protein
MEVGSPIHPHSPRCERNPLMQNFVEGRQTSGHPARWRRLGALAAAVAVICTAVTACTGGTGQSDQAGAPVTISFWHGWSLPNDVTALQKNIDAFHKIHPNITVKTVSNVSDDKILQGLRTSNGPDVVSSFTAGGVGALCGGALLDLNPKLAADGINKKKVFVPARLDYTQFDGKQCTLPLLGDALGLYYNTKMFADAGILTPPKTWTEFTQDAVKLTQKSGDGYSQLGFMPSFQGYESDVGSWLNQWNPKYFDSKGSSVLADDPQVEKFFNYTRSLVKDLGGYDALNKYRSTFGEEFSAQNPFEVGKVAMAFDGEWRIGNIRDDKSTVPYAVAPLPVPDDQLDKYGSGFLTGTVVGIGSKSRHQAAAWEFVKYLTTNTAGLVSFGNEIQNLPSTLDGLKSADLPTDPNFKAFLAIAANANSRSTPPSSNGGAYLEVLARFAVKWESGQETDLHAALKDVDKQIDAANAQSAK